jgi:hypothetical protein
LSCASMGHFVVRANEIGGGRAEVGRQHLSDAGTQPAEGHGRQAMGAA